MQIVDDENSVASILVYEWGRSDRDADSMGVTAQSYVDKAFIPVSLIFFQSGPDGKIENAVVARFSFAAEMLFFGRDMDAAKNFSDSPRER